MNMPSSLALPRSNFFRSRLGILLLALAAVIAGGGAYFALRQIAPPKLPTPATSPAAQAPVRQVPVVEIDRPLIAYGPPAPEAMWKPPAGLRVKGAATAQAPAQAGALPAPAVPVPGSGVPLAGAPPIETPKSLDASVLFAREQYVYTSGGRRDPFLSLLDGRFQSQSGDGALIDVGDIHLVGIMWGASDKFALVEDSRGRGYVLRVGDPVVNGYISGISKTELQIIQNAFGESQSMTIKLQPKEGDENATRK